MIVLIVSNHCFSSFSFSFLCSGPFCWSVSNPFCSFSVSLCVSDFWNGSDGDSTSYCYARFGLVLNNESSRFIFSVCNYMYFLSFSSFNMFMREISFYEFLNSTVTFSICSFISFKAYFRTLSFFLLIANSLSSTPSLVFFLVLTDSLVEVSDTETTSYYASILLIILIIYLQIL